MNSTQKKGKVILAGAGPGDPDLISVKALRYLQLADVVIVDRLVSEDLLITNAKAGAKIIRVGKQGRNTASTSQQTINDLLVEHATHSALVLRLKGGDVSFYSNVLDELETVVKFEIPFEIVPGITAASGAAAFAGFPLTARGYASSVRFLTQSADITWSETYWKELAATDDTLVFYMSMEFLDTLVEKLVSHEMASDKYLAIISEATTSSQRVHVIELREYKQNKDSLQYKSPTMIIVGKVVALHEKFQWFSNTPDTVGYFKSLDKSLN